ncbi:cytochrome-c peroxidase [Phocaeicola fibrisolvens]|uniref:cytochrome-c peroxidase n=1 Tax=Phocaeicola fibrisolvens TaxID=2981793 RepID=UPI000821CE34|nr:cytochrome-c peroxidase [Phocaeicola fibrisolvens]MCU6778588.1 cytochrome-c peroxidase [Phocaeicola fibrisolvens]SCH97629.1 Cytochrome c551 peroxidase precursor [uncultured Bacteroides sp.]
MKKSSKIILSVLVVAIVLCVVYRLVNKAPSASLESNAQMEEIIESSGCMACHSADPKLPFYAEFPVAGKLVKEDVRLGYRSFDMTPMVGALKKGEKINEVDLAKVEKVIADGMMPLAKYYLVHWGSSLTDTETQMALAWVKSQRETFYPNPLADKQWTNEAIRPVQDSVPVDMRKVILGNLLFHDVRLSADNTVSCSSCHGLNTGGVDNKPFSEGVGGQHGGVNAPTVFNALYNFVQFWDGRAATLADQAAGPPLNPVEMACKSFDEICDKLKADAAFSKAFTEVYPDGINEANITNAIQEFEKTLLTPNSRFDKYLKGDMAALTTEELAGYDLFKKYNCATCHVGENMGGQSYELMGIKQDYFADRGTELTVEDNGRFKETKNERDRYRFKVPGLRNVALTAPYFHDATQATLEDAVRAMGKYEVGVDLSQQEVKQIVAFLQTLTGEYQGKLLTNVNLQK